jgi:hypothetical protein
MEWTVLWSEGSGMSSRGERGMLGHRGKLLAEQFWRVVLNDGVWWTVLFILAAGSSYLLLQALTPGHPIGLVYRLEAGGLAAALPLSLISILTRRRFPRSPLLRGALMCAVYGMGGFVLMFDVLLLEVAFPGFLKSAVGAFLAGQVDYDVL